MNVAIANAMLREQIQRSRPFLILSLVICVLFVLIQRTTEFADEVGFQRLGIFFVHAVGFVSMLYCHSDDRNVSVLMPGYLLQLPVRTIDLVFCRFGYGLFCAAIITVGCSIVHFAILEPTELSFAFWTPFKVGIVTFALLQKRLLNFRVTSQI